MKLKIREFAKIKKADIELDGITVIAGENNAGKSTIGKVLFTIFNSMNDMAVKIDEEREKTIYQEAYRLMQTLLSEQGVRSAEIRHRSYMMARRFARQIMERNRYGNEINRFLQDFLQENGLEGIGVLEFTEGMEEKLHAIFGVSDEMITKEVLTKWFRDVFERQITPLVEKESKSDITIEIKGKTLALEFLNNECNDWKSEINILHQAFYVDNPFVIDSMSEEESEKSTEIHLLRHLCVEKENPMDGIFGSVMAKEKLKEIYAMLDKVIDGEIAQSSDGEFYLNSVNYSEPLNVKNLSTGLKSYAVIKQLLENGSLQEKDILILDEPEIHLHPEWQLLYAELIVLLQRAFDLTLVITTHSPYFLDAIDIYTSKYKRTDKVHYYLAENEGQMSGFYDVTNQIDLIYEKLSEPMQKLETMRNVYCTNEG